MCLNKYRSGIYSTTIYTHSVGVGENVVVVRGNSPVFAVIVLVRVVFLVVCEKGIKLNALLEVLGSFDATNVL